MFRWKTMVSLFENWSCYCYGKLPSRHQELFRAAELGAHGITKLRPQVGRSDFLQTDRNRNMLQTYNQLY